ncbi:ATPase, T2SS/T4P/T4SS family [Luteolibacter flavescens]|uniref:ATPase, T2SS/T4P/T4SS family n=1 Tax=Luteolibacter flavescens TaxID=1859460 RepID=A0ABT3FR66_9BACT|nr:ATPase, T2SS/T4P/T4SS family [Luteolibacter flavescens]MCW1885726.1 ATPase, T2SS/T4P/T4SS family [Luteolibacter flavescens]
MSPEIRALIQNAFTGGASDVFLIEGERPRVRGDGEIIIAHGGPVTSEDVADIWQSCGMNPETDNDGDSSFEVEDVGRLRVNGYRTLGRLGVVMRPIKKEIPSFEELGLPGHILASWMERRSGLIIVSGPTGSGKSTTIAACLEWVNRHHQRHIVTIEDPIEYLFENKRAWFSQREVKRDTESFHIALRAALRQNPDIILFGEIRDAESAFAALRAAETGHLVISTLHGSGVAGVPVAMERLNRIMSDSSNAGALSLLSHQLIGAISQQLLPRLDGGVIAVLEYFQNEAITRKWLAEASYDDLKDHLNKCDDSQGCSFLRYLIAAAQQGIIDPAVARTATDRPQDFDRAMRGIS